MTKYLLQMVLVQRITKMSKQFYFLKFAGRLLNICGAQKNILLFLEMRVTRTFFTPAAANFFFFNWFSEDIFFSSLVSFAFFCILVFSFTCLFVFLNKEKYFLMHVIYVLNFWNVRLNLSYKYLPVIFLILCILANSCRWLICTLLSLN